MKSVDKINNRIEVLTNLVSKYMQVIDSNTEGYDADELKSRNVYHLEEINILNWVLDDNKIR